MRGEPARPGDADLARFERGLHDATTLDHAEHVRVAFEMATRYSFDEALHRYATGLRRLTTRIGRPDRFHATLTTAFLALVAERRATTRAGSWAEFAPLAADLLDRRCLERWYDPSLLGSDVARATFVLPPPGAPRDP